MKKYLVIIEKSNKNYSACSPDVPGCIATGETVEDTLSNFKEALKFHLEDLSQIPDAKGIKYYLNNWEEEMEGLSSDFYMTELEIENPYLAQV